MANEVSIEMEALRVRLQKMRDRASNPNPVMGYIATMMHKDVMDHFDKEMGPNAHWKPLSPVTEAMRRKGKGKRGNKILQDTGLLRASIRPNNTKDTASVGTNVEYAEQHNEGDGRIPQRKFLWLSKPMIDLIKAKVGKFIIED